MANLLSRSRLQGPSKRSLLGLPERSSDGSHLTGRWDARRVHGGCREGWLEARAVIACDVEAVTHFIPYYRTRVFADTSYANYSEYPNSCSVARTYSALTPHARTHRTTVASLVHPPSRTHSPGMHAFLFASYLFCCHHIAQRLVLLSSVHIQPHYNMTTDTMNTLEHIAYVRLTLQLMAAGCLLLTATLWLAVLKDARK